MVQIFWNPYQHSSHTRLRRLAAIEVKHIHKYNKKGKEISEKFSISHINIAFEILNSYLL